MKKHSLILALVLCLALAALAACTQSPVSPSESDTAAETWLCSCGSGNTGKFCPECGEAKPESVTDAPTDGATEAPTEETTEDTAEETTEAPTEETEPEETETRPPATTTSMLTSRQT